MTAPYGALTIGRLVLTEPWEIKATTDEGRTLALSGQEAVTTFATPTQGELRARADQLGDYAGKVVPVTFSAFPHLDGWYRVGSASAEESTWYDTTVIEWDCDLTRVGATGDVEVECTLVGGDREHVSSAVAELWHAVPPGADSYLVGTGSPGYVDRVGSEGTVRVFRSIPAGAHPRYAVAPANYLASSPRISVAGAVRAGRSCPDRPDWWYVHNGLLWVSARESAGTFTLTARGTSSWGPSKVFDVKRNGVSLGAAEHVTILRNDPCECVVRLTYDHAPGRSTLDLALKRGARHVAVTARQVPTAGAWRIDDNGGGGTVSNQLTAAGYVERVDPDAAGDGWILGTTVAATAAGTFGLVASSPASVWTGYAGVVRGGPSAVPGDQGAVINAQYLGTPGETEQAVRR